MDEGGKNMTMRERSMGDEYRRVCMCVFDARMGEQGRSGKVDESICRAIARRRDRTRSRIVQLVRGVLCSTSHVLCACASVSWRPTYSAFLIYCVVSMSTVP